MIWSSVLIVSDTHGAETKKMAFRDVRVVFHRGLFYSINIRVYFLPIVTSRLLTTATATTAAAGKKNCPSDSLPSPLAVAPLL